MFSCRVVGDGGGGIHNLFCDTAGSACLVFGLLPFFSSGRFVCIALLSSLEVMPSKCVSVVPTVRVRATGRYRIVSRRGTGNGACSILYALHFRRGHESSAVQCRAV